jgi:hypothetical protein
MARETSVVTPQRFQLGFNYADYLAQIKVNKARFEAYHHDFPLKPEDTTFFRAEARRPNGPAKMLVLAEDWCGDVVRGLPILARMAEAAGLELRIFPRDQNLDIMDEFLKEGAYQSIPVAVFYSRDHRYLGHWIERPAVADRELAEIEAAIRAEHREINDQEFSRERRARSEARTPDWQQAIIQELKELLSKSPR